MAIMHALVLVVNKHCVLFTINTLLQTWTCICCSYYRCTH